MNKIRNKFSKSFAVQNEIALSNSALDHNMKLLKQVTGLSIIPVLKSNAYGHGLIQLGQMLNSHEVSYIAVDGYFEALELMKIKCNHEILILGAIASSNLPTVKTDFTYVVSGIEAICAMGESGRSFNIHLELDTGMGRYGCREAQLNQCISFIKKYDNLTLTGVMSHLADADNPKSTAYNDMQVALFDKLVSRIISSGFSPGCIHIAQSAGLTRKKSKHANAFRSGISLFGLSPLEDNDPLAAVLGELRPVLNMQSTVTAIQKLNKGDKVSYGLTFTAPETTPIAVIPLGYYEALPRSASNKISLTFGDKQVRQVGTICMNHTMLIGTDLKIGDRVTVISNKKDDPNSVAAISAASNCFPYELLVNIAPTIRRQITD